MRFKLFVNMQHFCVQSDTVFFGPFFPFSLWQKQSISYDQRWKALSFSTVITGISNSKHSIRLMNNRNKQTQAMAEEFRLVMQKKRMKGFAKMIGEKKKKNCYCDKMNANKKTVNDFE